MSCRTKIDNPEIITVFASSLLLNVCIAAVVMRQQRRHALSWGFGVRFAVSLFLAWLFYWHGLGWNTVKVAVLLAVVGVPFGTATIMMRVATIAPLVVRAVLAFAIAFSVAPLMPPIGILVRGITGDCP